MSIERMPDWLRWLAFIPLSLIAAIIASVGVDLFYKFLVVSWGISNWAVPARFEIDSSDPFNFYGYKFLSGLAAAFVFVSVGKFIAPRLKRAIGNVLAILAVLFLVIPFVVKFSDTNAPYFWFSIGAIIGAVSAARTENAI